MKKIENVRSNIKPPYMSTDEFKVYLNTDITEVPEKERAFEKEQLEKGQTLTPMYNYTVTEYDKDEFLALLLSTGQISLDSKTSAIEDMIMEMSEIIYA